MGGKVYKKVRGYHSWWLDKNGKSIGLFNVDDLNSDEEAEKYVDEIINLEAERDALKVKLIEMAKELEEVKASIPKIKHDLTIKMLSIP